MTLTFAQMQIALERYGFDTTDPLSTWINSAMHDMETVAEWTFLEVSETALTATAGNNLITVPTDFGRPIVLRDLDHLVKVPYMEFREFIRSVSNPDELGMPEIYTLTGGKMRLWRVPSLTVNFLLTYEANTPDLVNGADVPTTGTTVWPSATHYPIVVHAAEIGLMAENEEERASTARTQYQGYLMNLMGKYTHRQLDEVETVEDEMGYSRGAVARGAIGGW